MTTSHENLVVISGASTGMGAATATLLARRGFHVLAGVRRQVDADRIRATNLEPVVLDIADPETVRALAERVGQDDRPLVGLVNNAGIAVNAPVEALALDQWRLQFEVNLFGHVDVTQKLLPHLIRAKGRIVNISSLGGKVAMPTYGAYAGTKFALEAVSDALRRELTPHGVGVVVVEPGGVQTEMTGRGIERSTGFIEEMSAEHRERYGPLMQAIINQATAFTKNGVSADKAAEVIATALTTPKPKVRYTIGRDAAIMTRLARILPDRTLDRLAAANLKPHFPT